LICFILFEDDYTTSAKKMRTTILSILLIMILFIQTNARCSSSCRRRRRAFAAAEKIRKEAARIADVTCYHDNDFELVAVAPYSKYHFMPRCKMSLPRIDNSREIFFRFMISLLGWIFLLTIILNI